jgi:hypothetical protein
MGFFENKVRFYQIDFFILVNTDFVYKTETKDVLQNDTLSKRGKNHSLT